jgi:acyl-CoA thioesterase
MLTAEAKEISTHKKLCGYSVDVFDENNELVAKFMGTGYSKE